MGCSRRNVSPFDCLVYSDTDYGCSCCDIASVSAENIRLLFSLCLSLSLSVGFVPTLSTAEQMWLNSEIHGKTEIGLDVLGQVRAGLLPPRGIHGMSKNGQGEDGPAGGRRTEGAMACSRFVGRRKNSP